MKILLIQLGGSIDKQYPVKVNNKEFVINEPAFDHILQNSFSTLATSSISICKKDSLEMLDLDIQRLLEAISVAEERMIIITVGTDKMVEVAKAIDKSNKTIVVTGASLPYFSLSSDASFNIGMAVATVQTKTSGTYVVMNGQVFEDLDKVFKDPEDATFKYRS